MSDEKQAGAPEALVEELVHVSDEADIAFRARVGGPPELWGVWHQAKEREKMHAVISRLAQKGVEGLAGGTLGNPIERVRHASDCTVDLTWESATGCATPEDAAARIDRMRKAIDALPTPMILLGSGTKLVPLVGMLDSTRAAAMHNQVLERVAEKQLEVVIVDVLGIDVIDTATAGFLVSLADAVRLLGARFILTGIRAAVAQTLVGLGLNLDKLETHANVAQALDVLWGRGQKRGAR